MGFADTFTTRVQKLRGRMKRNAGAVSGDRRLEAEGRSEEVRGSLRAGREKLKAAASAAAVGAVPGLTRSARPDPAARLHPPDSDRDQRASSPAGCARQRSAVASVDQAAAIYRHDALLADLIFVTRQGLANARSHPTARPARRDRLASLPHEYVQVA